MTTMAKKRKTRKQKEKKTRNLEHVLESEAERIASVKDIAKTPEVQNTKVTEKAEVYAKQNEQHLLDIRKDALISVGSSLFFVAIIAGIFFYDQQSGIIEMFGKNLLEAVLQR